MVIDYSQQKQHHLRNKLSRTKLPNLILHLSNAPFHQIQQPLRCYNSSVGNEQKEKDKNRMREIITNYILPIEYVI